jgi:hypothetical protein
VIGAALPFYFLESVGQMGKSFRDDWADRDAQLTPEFFSDTQAVAVADTPYSQLDLSDEEQSQPTVPVRFDADGIAEQVDDEAEDVESEPLEPMPLPRNVGATAWGSAFAEIHARAFDLANYSKVTATRYIQSGSTKKISCLPSTVDFLADVQIVARKVLSTALYRVWREIYFEGYGKNAGRVPEAVQLAIQLRCGTAFKQAGLLPFHMYWQLRTKPEKLCAVSLALPYDKNEARNKRRRAARNARPVITTLAAA